MKKFSIILAVALLLITSSVTVLAQQPDQSSPLPTKSAKATEGVLPAFEEDSSQLHWGQKGNFTVYIGKTYAPLTANSLLRSAITYSSSDKEILTISETGSIAALKEGVVIIYATQGAVTIGKKLTVKIDPNPVVIDKNKEE